VSWFVLACVYKGTARNREGTKKTFAPRRGAQSFCVKPPPHLSHQLYSTRGPRRGSPLFSSSLQRWRYRCPFSALSVLPTAVSNQNLRQDRNVVPGLTPLPRQGVDSLSPGRSLGRSSSRKLPILSGVEPQDSLTMEEVRADAIKTLHSPEL
jgi:hypothetical protein